jgi:hypothetical protein
VRTCPLAGRLQTIHPGACWRVRFQDAVPGRWASIRADDPVRGRCGRQRERVLDGLLGGETSSEFAVAAGAPSRLSAALCASSVTPSSSSSIVDGDQNRLALAEKLEHLAHRHHKCAVIDGVAWRFLQKQRKLECAPSRCRQCRQHVVEHVLEQVAEANVREAAFGFGRSRREDAQPSPAGMLDACKPERRLSDARVALDHERSRSRPRCADEGVNGGEFFLPADDLERHSPRTMVTENVHAVVLVEGISDQVALEALAQRRGRNLDAEGISIVPIGGAQAIGNFLDRFGPNGYDVKLAGLCDAGEEGDFRRGLERAGLGSNLSRAEMEQRGFYVCDADLEDELIRSLGAAVVERVVAAQGELRSFRTLQKQAAWHGRSTDEQLRRFRGSGGRRKIRYARLLVDALDLAHVPRPLDRVLAHV